MPILKRVFILKQARNDISNIEIVKSAEARHTLESLVLRTEISGRHNPWKANNDQRGAGALNVIPLKLNGRTRTR